MAGQLPALLHKIENMDGVSNIDEIIEVSDGIMVAEGDMGVEIPLSKFGNSEGYYFKRL